VSALPDAPDVSGSVAANTTGVRAAPTATAPAAPITPRRDIRDFARWVGVGGVGGLDMEVTFRFLASRYAPGDGFSSWALELSIDPIAPSVTPALQIEPMM
jgi:hypothetical protein